MPCWKCTKCYNDKEPLQLVLGSVEAERLRGGVCERRFFTLILLLAMLHNMGISLFRFNGSLCRNENIASTGGAFLFLVLLLLGGFLLAKNDIPPWWIW